MSVFDDDVEVLQKRRLAAEDIEEEEQHDVQDENRDGDSAKALSSAHENATGWYG
jgi:hypothetical protein